MNIAILDDGICHDEFNIFIKTICVGKAVNNETFYQNDHYSHATVIAKILLKYCRPDQVIDVVFLNKDDKADISDMCSALEYCLENDIDVINLSCGIANFDRNSADYHRLVDVCRKLYEKGKVIYAAQNNNGRITVPACFPYTLSVENKESRKIKILSMYRRSDIYTTGKHIVNINGRKTVTAASNSYACAYAASQHFLKKAADNVEYSPLFTADFSFFSIKSNGVPQGEYDLFLNGIGSAFGRIKHNEFSSTEKRFLKKHNIKYLSLTPDKTTEKFILSGIMYIGDEYEIPIVKIRTGLNDHKTAAALYSEFKRFDYSVEIINTSFKDISINELFIPCKYVKCYSKILSLYNGNDILFVISNDNSFHDADDLEIIIDEKCHFKLVSENYCRSVNDIKHLAELIINYYCSEDDEEKIMK